MWFSENTLYTSIGSSVINAELKIYNVMGQLMLANKVNAYANNQLYLNLKTGLYIAELTTGATRKTLKLFIE